jgi:hypothetical protein
MCIFFPKVCSLAFSLVLSACHSALVALPDDGMDDVVELQAAIDEVAASGGGTLRLECGTYELSAPLYLRDSVTLQGCGAKTVLTNEGWNERSDWQGVTVFAGNLAPASFAHNDGRGYRGVPVERLSPTKLRFSECTLQPEAGTVVWLTSAEGEIGQGGFLRPVHGEVTLVEAVEEGCLVTLADAVSVPESVVLRLHSAHPPLASMNGIEPNQPIKNAALRSIQIRSANSQAVISSGCYGCEFIDITIGRSRRLIAIQGMRNSTYRNVSGVFGERGVEFAMLAVGNLVENVSARFEPRDSYPLRPSLRFGENAHGNVLRDIRIDLRADEGKPWLLRFDESHENHLENIHFIVSPQSAPQDMVYRAAGTERGVRGKLPPNTSLVSVELCTPQRTDDIVCEPLE